MVKKFMFSMYEIVVETVPQRYWQKVIYRQRYKKKIKSYMRKGKLVKAHTRKVWKKVTKKQRYWHKVERVVIHYKTKRFDFYGTKEEAKQVIQKCLKEKWIPKKRFVKGSAKQFLKHPEKYGYKLP